MITYLNGFKKKAWKDMTPAERIIVSERRAEVMSDPDSKAAHASLQAHFAEERKKKQKIQKLRAYLLAQRGLSATV